MRVCAWFLVKLRKCWKRLRKTMCWLCLGRQLSETCTYTWSDGSVEPVKRPAGRADVIVFRRIPRAQPQHPKNAHPIVRGLRYYVPVNLVVSSGRQAYYQRLCNVWAPDFEADMAEREFRGPDVVARLLRDKLQVKPTERILDYLCATGLLGIALKKFGFENIHGVDLAAEMIRFASTKGCYESCRTIELGETIKELYDVVAICFPLENTTLIARSAVNISNALKSTSYLVIAQPLPKDVTEIDAVSRFTRQVTIMSKLKLVRAFPVRAYFKSAMGVVAVFVLST